MSAWKLANVTARPLLTIFERSRPSGEYSETWKKANITPIFKKDKKEDLGNYSHNGLPHLDSVGR